MRKVLLHKRFCNRLDITIYNHIKTPILSLHKHKYYYGLFFLFVKVKWTR